MRVGRQMLVVLAFLAAPWVNAPAQTADGKEPGGLDANVVAAWEKAGASYGWVVQGGSSSNPFAGVVADRSGLQATGQGQHQFARLHLDATHGSRRRAGLPSAFRETAGHAGSAPAGDAVRVGCLQPQRQRVSAQAAGLGPDARLALSLRAAHPLRLERVGRAQANCNCSTCAATPLHLTQHGTQGIGRTQTVANAHP